MAKLTIRSGDESDEQKAQNKVVKKNITSIENLNQETIVQNETGLTTENQKKQGNSISFEHTVAWFIQFFGKEVFLHLKANPHLKIPFIDNSKSVEEWLDQALKTVCSFEDLQEIASKIQTNYIELKQNSKQLNEKQRQQEEQIQKFSIQNRQYELESVELRKENEVTGEKLLRSTSVQEMSEIIFKNELGAERIDVLFKEAVVAPTEKLPDFFAGFVKGWFALKPLLNATYENEKQKVEVIHQNVTKFLEGITGIIIPQRRVLLDALARYISNGFEEFIFVSPEETIQIDPAIHDAKGMGGTKVKEGLSFAVLRKQNRQTYLFADIKTY
jgi:hypothetical protein